MIVEKLDLIGKQFGNYKIVGELGRGGMAIVYKADEQSLNRIVALKILSPKISDDETMVKRFQREAQAVAKLNHPNIVHIYAIGEEDGVNYFTMEYIKGRTLRQVRKQDGNVSLAKAIAYMIQTADALGDAHKAGLVHRDVKPGNVMVDSADRVKVMDFGLARVMQATTQLTVDGSFLGTPQYMSPEQCEGKDIDNRSDIYSLGVTFYELLTGKIPVEGDTPGSMLVKIIQGELRPIREVDPSIPEEVATVIHRMMQTQKEKRPRNMEEVIADLRSLTFLCDDEDDATLLSIAAGPVLVKKNDSNMGLIVGVAAFFLLLVAGGGMIVRHYMANPSSDQSETISSDVVEPIRASLSDQKIDKDDAIKDLTVISTNTTKVEKSTPAKDAVVALVSVPVVSPEPVKAMVLVEKAVVPDENLILVTVSGSGNGVQLVNVYSEDALTKEGFEIVDSSFAAGKNPAQVARYLVTVAITSLGSRTLTYHGSSSQAHKVMV
ncbi:MAG: serine/threonine protein kinase, partial [Kiritimatiellae bacterium]|nr:serine/threonine protein kinase [Kiritimatiellia bacterium]